MDERLVLRVKWRWIESKNRKPIQGDDSDVSRQEAIVYVDLKQQLAIWVSIDVCTMMNLFSEETRRAAVMNLGRVGEL